MKKLERNKSKIFVYLSCFLLLGYLFLIWRNFNIFLSEISSTFGYIDYQHNWRGLEEFIRFRIPFKEYFYEYGWFFLFLQVPAYLAFSRSFLAVLISRHLYLPLVGWFLSYIVALNVLRKRHLVLIFLFFLLLFGTNYDFTSPRHLMAELSLSFFILFLFNKSEKHFFWSGIIGGLAVLTALEYGIALNLAVATTCFFIFLSTRKIIKIYFKKFLYGQLVILLPFFFWLLITGALRNYWNFTIAFINNFYYASPCSAHSFPRFEDISQLKSASKLLVFNLPVEFLQKVNFYLVIIFFILFLLVLFVRFFVRRKLSRDDLIKLSLAIYGLLISLRTLDNPCTGYFSYSLVPFFLLITFLIDGIISWTRRRKLPGLKAIGILGLTIIFSWFILTEYTGSVVKIFGKKEKPIEKETYAREFYSPAGWFIKKDYARDYKEVVDYIKKHLEKDDFLYVYPWGPYNNLANRKPPTSFTNFLQVSIAGEKFMELTLKELETKSPQLVVVNLYNNLGIAHYGKTREDVGRYFALSFEEGPVFAGTGNEVERFILENYEVVLNNDLAAIMEKRKEPIAAGKEKREIASWENWQEEDIELQAMKKIGRVGQYTVTGRDASWIWRFEKPVRITDIAIEFKIDGNFLTKHLARYFINFYLIPANPSEETHIIKRLAWRDWQVEEIALAQPKEIEELKIEMGKNTGFLWWLHPTYLEIKQITFYQLSD